MRYVVAFLVVGVVVSVYTLAERWDSPMRDGTGTPHENWTKSRGARARFASALVAGVLLAALLWPLTVANRIAGGPPPAA